MITRNRTHQSRTLHLVDADNLTGGPTEATCVAQRAAGAYRAAARLRPGDHTIVGSDWRSAPVTAFAWPGVRWVRTTGPDAVDHALIAELDVHYVAPRFGRVVIGSGDGIFADAMLALRAAGVTVEVVAPRHGVSYRLYPAADDISRVDDTPACSHVGCRLALHRSALRLAA